MLSVDAALATDYLLFCLNRWLSLVLQLIVSVLTVGILAVSLFSEQGTGAEIGVALNVILVTTGTLVALVSSWTGMETSLGAIARLKGIEEHTSQEDQPWEKTVPEGNWPARGGVTLKNFAAGYRYVCLFHLKCSQS